MSYSEEELAEAHTVIQEYFDHAIEVLKKRDKVYKGLWIDEGAEGNLIMLRHKALRLFRNYVENGGELSDNFTDDLLDMLNYTAFAMYCYDHGILKGE
jgi:hypothetical protein